MTQDSNEEKNDVENDEESNENNDLGISTEEDEIEIITSQEVTRSLQPLKIFFNADYNVYVIYM